MNGAGMITRALDTASCLVRSRTLDTIRAVRRRHDDFDAPGVKHPNRKAPGTARP